MRFTNDSLTLWYGTADAPAPSEGEVIAGSRASIVVAVKPAHPSNIVVVRYRVDRGPLRTIRATRLKTDCKERVDYHCAKFPPFCSGAEVAYLPTVSCEGRTSPGWQFGNSLPSSFRLTGTLLPLLTSRTPGAEPMPPPSRRPVVFDHLATITVPLGKPELIGETPEGIKANWYWSPLEGVVAGPKLNGKLRHMGGDWMTVRRDGVGLLDVRATIETTDGALLYVHYEGYCEFGDDGYNAFLQQRYPSSVPTRTAPMFHTAHPNYRWLNRVQCITIGEVVIADRTIYTYDLYAIR